MGFAGAGIDVNTRSAKSRGLSLTLMASLSLGPIPLNIRSNAQGPQAVEAADQDLEQSIKALRPQIEDPTYDLPQRESIAMELASTLDRAAQGAGDPATQRKRWDQAIELLDEFERKNPAHPQSRQFQLQAAVYRWASARGLRRQVDLNPSRPELNEGAIAELDDALNRFRKIPMTPAEKGDVLGNNLRFRFAQALADRADFETLPAEKTRRETEAKALLEGALGEPSIRGFALLLKGELLRREGRLAAALAEIDAAAKATPPPPERQLLGVRTSVLAALKRYDDALGAINLSHVEPSAKHLMTAQILLMRRAELAPGADRYPIDSRLFDEIGTLRALRGPDARIALLALARARLEPDPRLGANAWDILADAWEAVGDPIRASGLEEKAAVRAEDSGQPERAIDYRLKSGALLFRAGKFLEADAVLSRVTRLKTPESVGARAKANLLRAMSLGRAVATKIPGASASSYKAVLEAQVKDFPDDPSTDEARWLLGDLVLGEGNRDRAASLWSAIGAKSPRWLNSRRAVASLDRASLMDSEASEDPTRVSSRFRRAADFLDRSIEESPGEAVRTELLLDRALLDLSPEARNGDEAREIAERVGRSSITEAQRSRADLIRMIALAQLGRYVEAELIARRLAESPDDLDPAVFLETIRLLDRSATTAESDLRQRRFGLLMRMLLTPVVAREASRWQAGQVPELFMRLTRALIFMGDDRAAKGSLAAWKGSGAIKQWNDPLLRDLADTYVQLNADELATDVQRLRLKSLASGSPAWLEARYGLAVAFYRSGKPRDAAKLIEATAILHPELGGGPLKEKFNRLRQRLGDKP